ncbi:putative filamentous hemagglutinin [Erwinia sp. Ejp617]|nr:putative filamentous hemagglutinin [Erwinia sp. Ejp617]
MFNNNNRHIYYDSADTEKQVYQNFYNQALTESQFGTGGKCNRPSKPPRRRYRA